MEQHRQPPSQPPAQSEQEYPEVVLEPIEDIGLRKMKSVKRRAALKKKRQRRRVMIIVLSSVVALLLIALTFFFINYQREAAAKAAAEEALRIQLEQERKEFDELANSTVFCNGISVNGISIGGMTMDQAKAALAPTEQNLTSQKSIPLTYNGQLYSLDLSGMSYTTNLNSILKEAYRLGKTGDYAGMKAEKSDVEINGRKYTLTISYDMTSLLSGIAQIAAQIDAVPQDAGISSVDEENHTILFTDEVVGRSVDQNLLAQRITDALLNGVASPVEIPVTETQPAVTRASLEGKYVQRNKECYTSFSSSTSERKYNIRKGAKLINGTVLKPGEVFSTNDVLGTRTKGNGWKEANAYESGTVVPQYGGGVCQLSSTLYNAVVKADLEIVFRRNHSMPVTYIDKGLDATINSVGNEIDFQFKNNTLGDIVIFGYTTDNNRLYFEIWGLPFATTEYDEIKLTSDRVSTTSPDGDEITVEVPVGTEKADGTLMVEGETYQAIARRDGYVYQSYKNYYLAGTFVRKEKLALSTYKSFAGEIWTCMVATPEPEITPETLPEETPSLN